MKHSERGVERIARNVRPGHTIRWCGHACLVLDREFPRPRGTKRYVLLTVDVPKIGERRLSYEVTERIVVLDFDDPRLRVSV